MKKSRLIWCICALLSLLVLRESAQAALLAQETSLTASVTPTDLNIDSQNVLWVSDADAGQIRSVNPSGGAYTIYTVGGSPSDARSDGAGTVWWADFNSNQLSRLTTANNVTTTWEISGSSGLWGTALAPNGEVWASDGNDPYLYRLNPTSNQLCQYTFPSSGVGEYLISEQTRIWIGDSFNGRIVRLEGTTFTWWNLPVGSQPRDLALDGSGRVWWTDVSKGYVGRLNPAANQIITYTPPTTGVPEMLTLANGKVWYTQQNPSRIVELDPATASGITATVTISSSSANPSCNTVLPQPPAAVTPITGHATWNGNIYSTLMSQAGWSIYCMPVGAVPYGIVSTPEVWLVDQGRQLLAKVVPSLSFYLPVIIKSSG